MTASVHLFRISSLAVLLAVVLGCESSQPRPGSTDDAGSHEDAAEDSRPSVPDLDAASADSGPGDAGADAASDAEPPPGPCFRDTVIEADEDVAAIAECTDLFGTLTLTGPKLTKVELPRLEHLGGGLTVMASGLEELELPALMFVGKDLSVIDNERLTRIALPQLASTVGSVWIGANAGPDGQPALTSIELPSLTRTEALAIFGNRALSSLALPVLELPRSIDVHGNPALIELDLPAVSFVDLVLIEDNDALEAVRMPSLVEQQPGGDLRFTGKTLVSIDLSALRSAIVLSIATDAERFDVQLPELNYAGELRIGPTNATRIVLPKLERVYSKLSVSENPLLTSLELPALTQVGYEWSVVLDEESGWGLFIEDDAQLTNVELPALYEVGKTLSVQSDAMLSSLTLTSLREVRGILVLRESALTTFSAPVLTKIGTPDNYHTNEPPSWYGELIIEDNPLLESLDLPALTGVGAVMQIIDNPSLPTCDAQMLSDQLSDHPELPPDVTIMGNAGTCP